MRYRILFFLTLISSFSFAGATLRVRIYTSTPVSSFSFAVNNSSYLVRCDSAKQFRISNAAIFKVTVMHDSLILKKGDSLIGKFAVIRVDEAGEKKDASGTLMVRITKPEKTARVYDDGLELSAKEDLIRILNIVDIEHYTRGVIQAEVGKMNPIEFNKVKAIIIRTYSLSNLRKHELENYHLCDQTHCQVYRGQTLSSGIIKAVNETKGLVLVDTGITLVNASFFSNCGGQTCNSEDVWVKALPYLRSVKDTFCIHAIDARWEKKIAKTEWLNYFEKKFNIKSADTEAINKLLSFTQDSRKNYLLTDPVYVPLKVLREDWKLKSTFFSVSTEGEFVLLKGKGFGHGVGLCQEGAMRMAKLGYRSSQIIDFYFKDVTLIDLSKLEFFKEE